jgi:transposase
MKDKQITSANEDGLFRLRAVEMVQKGETLSFVSKSIGVHYTTISEWVKMYKEGGIERLNTYRKPRPKYELDEFQILGDMEGAYKKETEVLNSLLELCRTKKLNETASKFGISPQGLAQRRRVYLTKGTAE